MLLFNPDILRDLQHTNIKFIAAMRCGKDEFNRLVEEIKKLPKTARVLYVYKCFKNYTEYERGTRAIKMIARLKNVRAHPRYMKQANGTIYDDNGRMCIYYYEYKRRVRCFR